MFCKNCGAKLNEGVKFCQNCGSVVEGKTENSSSVVSTTSVNASNAPMPMNQPMMNTPQQPSGGKKKNDIILFVVIGIIGVALILVPIILTMGKEKEIPATNTNSNTGVNTNTNSHSNTHSNFNTNTNTNTHSNHVFTNSNTNSGVNTNTNSNTNTNTNSNSQGTKEVTLSGYTFQVPKQVIVEENDGDLTFTNLRTKNDESFLGITTDNYDKYKNSKELVKQQMQSTGLTVGEVTVQTYGGVEFIVIPVSQGSTQMVYGIAKLSPTEIAMVMVANTATFKFDYTLLNEMGNIIKTAKKTSQL